MYKKINDFFCFTLVAFLISATVLPGFVQATSQLEIESEKVTFNDEKVEVVELEKGLEEYEHLNDYVDQFLEEMSIADVNFDELTEEEAEAFFEEVVSDKQYYSLENEINRSINEMDRADYVTEEPTFSTRALPIAFAAIGVVALRIAVTQGTKAATAYLKKATKKYTTQYKITFPSSKQLILIQDKKSKKRLFSLDNHSVKLVHKTTGKGYSKAFSAWHFHKSPDMTQHYLMCSSIPKNYKVQKGKCYF